MLLPYLKVLNGKRIILGSQSKSRNELMQTQRLNYKIIPSKFEENLDKESFASPSEYNLVHLLLSRKPARVRSTNYWLVSKTKRSSGMSLFVGTPSLSIKAKSSKNPYSPSKSGK
jgi:hypothetical protein